MSTTNPQFGRWNTRQRVKVVSDPQYTKNLFGSLSAIAGREHELMERNGAGDCMIIVDGQYLVDVDSRDVEKEGKE